MGVFEHLPYANFHNLNLDWILQHIEEFKTAVDGLEEWKNTHEQEYQKLLTMYNNIVNGQFPDAMKNSLEEWVTNNANYIIENLVKMIFFGLTDAGYFIAYIPDGWDDIIFNTTGYDLFDTGVEYGHLTLSY